MESFNTHLEEEEEQVLMRRQMGRCHKRRWLVEEKQGEADQPAACQKANRKKQAVLTSDREEHGSGADPEERGCKAEGGAPAALPQVQACRTAPRAPPPPAARSSRCDVLSLLFACPAFVGELQRR